jgi:hypothetical protein
MKFADKFDDAVHMDEFNVEGDWIVFSAEKATECWHCLWPTNFYSISFCYAALCSEECLTAKWNEYWEALRRAPWTPPDEDALF